MRNLFLLLLLTAPAGAAQTGNVSLSYGSGGLTALSYNGYSYLSQGQFRVNAVNLVSASGQVSPASVSGTTTYDIAHTQTTNTYSWGSVVVRYAASGNKLSFTITTTNKSALTIQGVFYEPLDLRLPAAPQEFDGVTPILGENLGNPTALRLTAGTNALVLANDDVTLPLLVGFPWSLNSPTNTIFPLRVETSQDPMFPNSIPFINRPILPGASDTYHISLRFGSSNASTKSLVSDVYQSFATTYPATLKWPDRRPIGQLILGSTATGFPTNPRGWFNDPSVDVTTPQGVAAFQARVLSWASNAVTILKSLNSQGMVTWDIEGEQYPQPTTYIGDPTQFATLAPEMAGVIDQYFKTFTAAGLRVGICIRPQQLVIPPGGGAPTQTSVADPTSQLLAKVTYAYQRWGATLFYIDSNGDPNFPISSQFFQTVAAKYPQVLLIPEHQTDSYFAFGSWYGELRGGVNGTPQSVLDVYPQAFSVIYLPDGSFSQYQAALTAAIHRGDIAMFRAWYADPQNQEIDTLYPSGGVAPSLPVIATPANNSNATGTLELTATVAPGPAGVADVEYLLDGAATGSPVSAPPFQQNVNIGALATGIHTIQAVAADSLGDLGFASANFFVPASAVVPPAITFSAPANESQVSGVLRLTAEPEAQAGVLNVQFSIDGQTLGDPVSTAPFQIEWNTLLEGNGAHSVVATVTDFSGTRASATLAITVSNPTGPAYLSGTPFTPGSTRNLTALGTADWIELGLNPGFLPNRKTGTAAQLSGATAVGNFTLNSYSNNPVSFTWSDGAPLATATNTAAGLFACGQGNGFQITAPAGIAAQTLTLYTGVYMSQLRVEAQLSDHSAPPYINESFTNLNGQRTAAYSLNFRAAAPGQLLTVTVTQADASVSFSSNVTLNAATLSPAEPH